MRILHTSDWHLGRTFHGASLAGEQAAAVDALVDVVRAEGVEVVLVAGDLYDRQLPPTDAVDLLSHALEALVDAGATVVVSAGNHDSAARLRFGGGLLARAGVHVAADLGAVGRPVLVAARDGGPDLAVYAVPYLEPEIARHALGVPDVRGHDALLRVALDRARTDLGARGQVRSVVVAHAFVAGGTPSDSERALAVGGAERVGVGRFAGFDYAALGHLHGRQVLGDGRVRYSGSPLAYSFSERGQRKGAWLVDLPPAGGLRVEAVDPGVGRSLAALRGTLAALLADPALAAAERSWVQAVLTDQELPRDAMARLRARFPHALVLLHEPPVPVLGGAAYRDRVRGRGDLDLVGDFVVHVTGRPLSPDERDDCAAALDAVARGAGAEDAEVRQAGGGAEAVAA